MAFFPFSAKIEELTGYFGVRVHPFPTFIACTYKLFYSVILGFYFK